jgi:hypothetical protein
MFGFQKVAQPERTFSTKSKVIKKIGPQNNLYASLQAGHEMTIYLHLSLLHHYPIKRAFTTKFTAQI